MKNNKGFSLTELMIVVAVMSILVAVAIPVYNGVSNGRRIDDCAMNRQMISVVVQEVMNGMIDNGKKQDEIIMRFAQHKVEFPDQIDGKKVSSTYAKKECFKLSYDNPFTLGDIRGGYRATTISSYDVGCKRGNYLKREELAVIPFYTYLANGEIPICAFQSDNDTYSYYIFSDATVLCDCPKCLDNLGLLSEITTENE
ncbi:MAG: prepilin-type N-terminal cleavage/methylation domain-containing protein [Clostridia bacterium]|nr:prepilin-type N-terminal cleavage/methylation domain-containing protein [Clostridia bacterium]